MNMLLRPASPALPSPSPPSHAGVRSIRGTGAPACTPDSPLTTLQYATLSCNHPPFTSGLGSCSMDQLINYPGGLWRGRHSCARAAGRADHARCALRCIFPRPACLLGLFAVATLPRNGGMQKGRCAGGPLVHPPGWQIALVSCMHPSTSLLHSPPSHKPPTLPFSRQRDICVRATPSGTLSCMG